VRPWGQIILLALDWFDRIMRRKRTEERADRVETIRNNPAAEFAGKFGRVPDDQTGMPGSEPATGSDPDAEGRD